MASKIFGDASKICALAIIIFEDKNVTAADLLYNAEQVAELYLGSDNIYADDLEDEDPEVRKNARKEKKALERFIKKYKGAK